MSKYSRDITPKYDELVGLLNNLAGQLEYKTVAPTPLVSDFWSSTFTPSSSEILFRHLYSSNPQDKRVYTIQPCIRITDLPYIGDGWHKLFFHMASFMCLSIEEYDGILRSILLSIAGFAQKPLSKFGFTYSTTPIINTDTPKRTFNLGREFLLNCGASADKILECPGSSNYQEALLKTANRLKISMVGPKIEMFDIVNGDEYREMATFQIALAKIDSEPAKPVFGIAVGLERLAAIRDGLAAQWDISERAKLAATLATELLPSSLANSQMGKKSVLQCLEVLEAIIKVREEVPPGANFPNRGIKNHYLRMIRELGRSLTGIGIPISNLLDDMELTTSCSFLPEELVRTTKESQRPEYAR